MSNVEIHLEMMRLAADRLQQSSQRIENSVLVVQQLLDTLMAYGLQSPALADLAYGYYAQRSSMDTWAQQLRTFATHLTSAADEIRLAVSQQNGAGIVAGSAGIAARLNRIPPPAYPGVYSLHPSRVRRRKPALAAVKPVVVTEPTPPPKLTEYVSTYNRPVYDMMLQKKEELLASRRELTTLYATRTAKLEELAATENRLVSYDSTIELDKAPRIIALRGEIATLDMRIGDTQTHIQTLQTDISTLQHRLERVAPGAGADLDLIARMETAETLAIIKENTQDCVKYIVTRMAVPPGLPTDAHLWDENALRLTEYGITVGDTPLEGSVLVMERAHPYSDDVYGHVMYVEKVADGNIYITDNLHPTPVSLASLTDEIAGENIKYLYFPWQTKA